MADDVIRNDYFDSVPTGSGLGIFKRISWGAIWAGVMAALGMEILLTLFGLFVGFGRYDAHLANPWSGVVSWTTVWYLVTVGWSMFFGAWCASRLSGNPVPGDGMLHGITTWGLASTAAIAVLFVASWAVLREGIDVLSTVAIAAGQVGPVVVETNRGSMAQATANIISGLSLRIFLGLVVGLITAILGGWLGRSRTVVVTPEGVVPLPTRRAA
jgi:hypothetical protein